MKTTMICFVLCLVAASAAAQSVAGDWQGTLKFGPGELRLVLHITETGAELAGTIDSPDQNVKGIPVSAISRKGNALKLDLMSIQGGYEGIVDAGATSIKGTWTQLGMSAPLDWSRAVATPARARAVKGSDVDGDWEGILGGMLRLVIHVTTYEDGMSGTFDSPDQNVFGLPVTSISRSGSTLKFELKQIAGEFSGTLKPDLSAVDGTWNQLGNSLPLGLARTKRQ